MSLTSTSSTVEVGSSVTLTCSFSLSNESQYIGANTNFQYQFNGGIVFRDVNIAIRGNTLETDSTEPLTMNTSSAGTYTCNVTINAFGNTNFSGSSASGQNMTQITVQSKLSISCGHMWSLSKDTVHWESFAVKIFSRLKYFRDCPKTRKFLAENLFNSEQ